MTLVELMIASTLLLVLMTAVMITMDMLNTVSNSVNAQYQEFQQALPALAPLQNLLRAEVEPGPPSTVNGNQIPQPGFQTIGNFSLTFFSDIGTAYNNVTSLGTTGGPAKVVALEVDATGNAVTTATTCSTSSPCNFQVRQYLPIITAGVSQCPTANQGGTACTYPATYKVLVNVVGVVNNPALAPTERADPTDLHLQRLRPQRRDRLQPDLGPGPEWGHLRRPHRGPDRGPVLSERLHPERGGGAHGGPQGGRHQRDRR